MVGKILNANTYAAAWLVIFDCVVAEIENNAVQKLGDAVDNGAAALKREAYSRRLRFALKGIQSLARKLK